MGNQINRVYPRDTGSSGNSFDSWGLGAINWAIVFGIRGYLDHVGVTCKGQVLSGGGGGCLSACVCTVAFMPAMASAIRGCRNLRPKILLRISVLEVSPHGCTGIAVHLYQWAEAWLQGKRR